MASPTGNHLMLPLNEHYVNQLKAKGVTITKTLSTLLALYNKLNINQQLTLDDAVNIVLKWMEQYEKGDINRLTDSELSNILLQQGLGSLLDILFDRVCSLSRNEPLGYSLHFHDEDSRYFLAAVHVLTGSQLPLADFMRQNVLTSPNPMRASVLPFIFGLANSLLGKDSSTLLLRNVLEYLACLLHADRSRPVVYSSLLCILILQCLFEAQDVALYKQAQNEIFVQQMFSFDPQTVADNVDAIAYYLLNVSSVDFVWTVYAPVDHPLLKKLDDLKVAYIPLDTMFNDSTHNIVISTSTDRAVLISVATSTTYTSTGATIYDCMTEEQRSSVHLAEARFRANMTRRPYLRDDHIRFSFPPTMRSDVFEDLRMSPRVPMHWVKMKGPPDGHPPDDHPPDGHPPDGHPPDGHVHDATVVTPHNTYPEVTDCTEYLEPFHQTTIVDGNQIELFGIKDELVCGNRLPKLCNETKPLLPRRHKRALVPEVLCALVLPSYGVARPPCRATLEEEEKEFEDTTVADTALMAVDQGEGCDMVGGLFMKHPDQLDMTVETFTTCVHDYKVSSVPQPDLALFPGVTPDITVCGGSIDYRFHEKPLRRVSSPKELFQSIFHNASPSEHEIRRNVLEGFDNPGSCFYGDGKNFQIGNVYLLPEQLPHVKVLNKQNGNETLEVLYKGTFYSVRKTVFKWKDVSIMPRLSHKNILETCAMLMGDVNPLHYHQYKYLYYQKMSYDFWKCRGSYERYFFSKLRNHVISRSKFMCNLQYVTKEILSALDYLHTLPSPVVHRDVNPSNIPVLVKTNCCCDNVLVCTCREHPSIVLAGFDACLELSASGQLVADSSTVYPQGGSSNPVYHVTPASNIGFQSPEDYLYIIGNSADVLTPLLSTKADMFSFGMLMFWLLVNVSESQWLSQVDMCIMLLFFHQSTDGGRLPQSKIDVLKRSGVVLLESNRPPIVVTKADIERVLPVKRILKEMEVPESLSLLIINCLSIDPRDRPTAGECLLHEVWL